MRSRLFTMNMGFWLMLACLGWHMWTEALVVLLCLLILLAQVIRLDRKESK